jgi:23S rRNA (guanosine2251-2'-O)-methyltransferase
VATAPAIGRLGALAQRPGLELTEADPRRVGHHLPADAVHQGLALEVGPLTQRRLDEILAGLGGTALLLAIDQVSDPRNLGAILRSAVAFGAAAVLLPSHGSADLGPACAKAASGALDLIPIVEVANLAHALGQTKEAGFWAIGLDAEAPMPLAAAPAYERRALVLGAEGRGLRRLTAERCDLLACLPIAPAIESLNVAVAAGIALYLLAAPGAGT